MPSTASILVRVRGYDGGCGPGSGAPDAGSVETSVQCPPSAPGTLDTLATAGTPEQSGAGTPGTHNTHSVNNQQILLSVTPKQDVFILKRGDFSTRIESPLPYPKSKGPKKSFIYFKEAYI